MKTYFYIAVLTVFLLSSCSSSVYMSGEYDDLYYTPAPSEIYVQEDVVPEQAYQSISEIESKYDLDTLVADEYLDPAEYEKGLAYYDSDKNSAFDYHDGVSYASNLNRFYGNYFDPYWRDPFYSGYRYGSAFRYGMTFGYPYSSYYGYGMMDPYYSPYYYSYYRDPFYSPYYGSSYYYSPYWGYGGLGMSPYYSAYYNRNVDYYTTPVKRRRSYSTLSNRYVSESGQRSSSTRVTDSRRTAGNTTAGVRGDEGSRRTRQTVVSSNTNVREAANPQERSVSSAQNRRTEVNTTTRASSRPEYRTQDRTYSPTYTNPRMTTRPAYNNANRRSSSVTNSNAGRTIYNRSGSTSDVNRSGRSAINRSSSNSTRSIINRSSTRGSSINSSRSSSRSSAVRSSGGRSSSISTGRSSVSSSSSRSSSSGNRSTSGSSGSGRTGRR